MKTWTMLAVTVGCAALATPVVSAAVTSTATSDAAAQRHDAAGSLRIAQWGAEGGQPGRGGQGGGFPGAPGGQGGQSGQAGGGGGGGGAAVDKALIRYCTEAIRNRGRVKSDDYTISDCIDYLISLESGFGWDSGAGPARPGEPGASVSGGRGGRGGAPGAGPGGASGGAGGAGIGGGSGGAGGAGGEGW